MGKLNCDPSIIPQILVGMVLVGMGLGLFGAALICLALWKWIRRS